MKLPQELEDLIFLHLNLNTLQDCRELQSEFVKTTTMYFNFSDAAKDGNLKNLKWLKEQGCPWDDYTFSSAAEKWRP